MLPVEHFKPHDRATRTQRTESSDTTNAGASPLIGFRPNFRMAVNVFRSATSQWASTVQILGRRGLRWARRIAARRSLQLR